MTIYDNIKIGSTDCMHPFQSLVEAFGRKGFWDATHLNMRNAVGFIIVLWGLSQFFSSSFTALDGAARESFHLIEVTAVASQEKMQENY